MQHALEWCGSCWAVECNLLCQVWILPKHKNTWSVFSIQVGGLCVGLHYNIVVSAGGCMAAGAHAPSAAARLRKKGGSRATEIVMKKGTIVFHTGNMAMDLRDVLSDTVQKPMYINHADKGRGSTCKDLLWDQSHRESHPRSLILLNIWR